MFQTMSTEIIHLGEVVIEVEHNSNAEKYHFIYKVYDANEYIENEDNYCYSYIIKSRTIFNTDLIYLDPETTTRNFCTFTYETFDNYDIHLFADEEEYREEYEMTHTGNVDKNIILIKKGGKINEIYKRTDTYSFHLYPTSYGGYVEILDIFDSHEVYFHNGECIRGNSDAIKNFGSRVLNRDVNGLRDYEIRMVRECRTRMERVVKKKVDRGYLPGGFIMMAGMKQSIRLINLD